MALRTNVAEHKPPSERLGILERSAVWVFLIATVAMNALATVVKLGGNTPASISDRYQVFFTPAGYVFSIWSVIYAGLFAFAVYQTFVRGDAAARASRVTRPFLLTCLFNVAWIFSWHYEYLSVSMLVMLALLATLLVIYQRLGDEDQPMSLTERVCLRWPLRIYTAWINVATLANLTILLEDKGLRPFAMSASSWAILMLALVSTVAIVVGLVRRDNVFLAVFAWALIGIAVENGAGTPVFDAALSALSVVAAMMLSVIARSSFWSEWPNLLTWTGLRRKGDRPSLAR